MGRRRPPERSDGMTQTVISDEKIEVYKSTNYIVLADAGEFTIRVDQYSEALADLFKSTNRQSSTFITAYNPLNFLQDRYPNEADNNLWVLPS